MKKFAAVLFGVVMIFAMIGSAQATLIDLTQDFNPDLYTGPPHGTNPFSFQFTLPSDFAASINTASLILTVDSGGFSGGDKDNITINGNTINMNSGSWVNLVGTFNILSYLSPLPSGNILTVEIENTDGSPNAVTLDKAELKIDYTPISSNPVPEPASLLLVGCGLVGLAAFRKKTRP